MMLSLGIIIIIVLFGFAADYCCQRAAIFYLGFFS
jgi:hypothetical protein